MFKLKTGHECLSKHLHKIGMLPSPNCLLCSKEEEITLQHLLNCEELKLIEDVTSKYWEARRRMTLLLNPEQHTRGRARAHAHAHTHTHTHIKINISETNARIILKFCLFTILKI